MILVLARRRHDENSGSDDAAVTLAQKNFLDRDIKVDGRNVSGSVERSPWMFRVYAGFEF